jgi:hypothetical protein
VIVRPDGEHLLLITQPDHAALAARLMAAWQRDGLPTSPRRDVILLATAEHDNGWREDDAAPIVDRESGRVIDFMHAPDDVRQRIWPRGVARLAASPYAAALVAEHAIEIYRPNRVHPEWTAFFAEMERIRDAQLRRAAPLTLADLARDYFFVRMGDLLSLTFCCGWLEDRRHGEYDIHWTGARLTVHPDPFDGREVDVAVPARRFPRDRPVTEAFAGAPVTTLRAVASGS